MYEVGQVLPRKCTVLHEYRDEVGMLKTSSIPRPDICIRINVKLGGTNVVPELQDISFHNDTPNQLSSWVSLSLYGVQLRR